MCFFRYNSFNSGSLPTVFSPVGRNLCDRSIFPSLSLSTSFISVLSPDDEAGGSCCPRIVSPMHIHRAFEVFTGSEIRLTDEDGVSTSLCSRSVLGLFCSATFFDSMASTLLSLMCENRKNLLLLRNRRLKGEIERGREERELVRFSE